MKKDTILRIAAVFAVSMLYSNANAYTDFTVASTVSVGAQQVKPSNNVTIRVASASSAFACQASHSSGDRKFGTNYTNTKIYWSEGRTLDTDVSTDSVYTGAGWSAL